MVGPRPRGTLPVVCDHHEIANQLYEYGYLIDAGDFDGIGRLLSDALLIADGTPMNVRGAEAIARHYASTTRLYEDTGTPKTKHIFTNMKLEIDAARGVASGKTNYVVLQQTDELALQPIVAGHYEHRFEKRGDSWRITEKKFFVDQVGDLSHHLLIDLDDAQTTSPGASQG